MANVDFFLGLAVGLSLYLWQQYYFRSQLKKIIKVFSASGDRNISLPPLSLIRRELYLIDEKNRKLEQIQENWRNVVEKAPIGYLLVNGDNQLLWCNSEAQSLLKIDRWPFGELRLLLELVRSYELDRLIEKTRQTKTKQEKEWVFYFTKYVSSVEKNSLPNNYGVASQIVNSIEIKGYAFPLSNDQVGVFLVNLQPIVELSQSRDRAFSDLAHEFKTPLTSISLVGENLLNRLQNPEHRWVEQMLKEVKRLTNLAQEWLDISRLQDDPTQVINYQTLDLSEVIVSVWEILEPIAAKKQVTLDHNPTVNSIIEGDKSRLMQVFLNLLDNAIKHSPSNSRIVVNISMEKSPRNQNSSQAVVDIIDSGSGFAESDLPHVFERLYRGDKSRTRSAEFNYNSIVSGYGLGLAIAKQIVYSHKGSIQAQNHPEHGGAWIRLSLPSNP